MTMYLDTPEYDTGQVVPASRQRRRSAYAR